MASPAPDEEAPLVGAQQNEQDAFDESLREAKARRFRMAFGVITSVFIALALTLAIVGGASKLLSDVSSSTQQRSIVLIIPDGFGPASETMAREFRMTMDPTLPVDYRLPLDDLLVGTARTRSSSSLITDSAAGATAYSCGIKSYNGAIGVDPAGTPCGTVLEAAHAAGLLTGLVATSRITHATPASFNAHVLFRDDENLIAEYQVGLGPLGRAADLMFGGGRCHFLPAADPTSCRTDSKDLLVRAKEAGFSVHTDRKALDSGNMTLPVLALFTPDHMSYEVDRDPAKEPSLAEMAGAALDLLSAGVQGRERGFFLMVECSRIDMAAHANDPAAHVRDILACQDAVEVVRKWVDGNPGAVMVGVADHETGGMTIARQIDPNSYPIYQWYPQRLAPVLNGSELLAAHVAALPASVPDRAARERYVRDTVLARWTGVADPTDAEVACLAGAEGAAGYAAAQRCLAEAVSVRAQVGWTTRGHSGVDVNLYARGLHSEKLRGNHDNTEVSRFIQEFLGLELEGVTERLKGAVTSPPTPAARAEASPNFKEIHYHSVSGRVVREHRAVRQ